jgi:hypothetical protein
MLHHEGQFLAPAPHSVPMIGGNRVVCAAHRFTRQALATLDHIETENGAEALVTPGRPRAQGGVWGRPYDAILRTAADHASSVSTTCAGSTRCRVEPFPLR